MTTLLVTRILPGIKLTRLLAAMSEPDAKPFWVALKIHTQDPPKLTYGYPRPRLVPALTGRPLRSPRLGFPPPSLSTKPRRRTLPHASRSRLTAAHLSVFP